MSTNEMRSQEERMASLHKELDRIAAEKKEVTQ